MTDQNDHDEWYLIQFKPNSHRIAQRNLSRQGFTTFLPQHEETKRVRDKFTTRTRPLFPGYLFVSINVAEGRWREVNSTLGVVRLVSLAGKPARVPSSFITDLMQRCDSDGQLIPPRTLEQGTEVLLTKGPFANLIATIEAAAPDQRIWVLLDLLGAPTRVAVKEEHLRSI